MRSETPAQLHLKVGPSVVTDSLILRGDGYRTMKVAGAAAVADKRQTVAQVCPSVEQTSYALAKERRKG